MDGQDRQDDFLFIWIPAKAGMTGNFAGMTAMEFLKLAQEAEVVGVEVSYVVYAVLEHGDALRA